MRRLSILPVFVLLAGCGGGNPSSKWALAREVGGELLRDGIVWTAIGTCAGLVLGVAAHFFLQLIGGLRWDWPPARFFRWLSLAITALVFASFVGAAGFTEGLLRSTDWALQESSVAAEYSPALGSVGADFVGALYFVVPRLTASSAPGTDEIQAQMEQFRNDDWQIGTDDLRSALDQVNEKAIDTLMPDVRGTAQEMFPSLREGLGADVLDIFLNGLGDLVLRLAVSEEILAAGESRDWIQAAAALNEDPEQISHQELSTYLVGSMTDLLIRLVIRPTARAQQIAFLLPLPFFLLIPVIFFRGAHFLHQTWQQPSS